MRSRDQSFVPRQPATDHCLCWSGGADFGSFIRVRQKDGRDGRNRFLQEHFARADDGVGVESTDNDPIEQHVRDRRNPHRLMVRHVAAHRQRLAPGRYARGAVVDCIVKTETAQRAL